jgi:hypothetical protein
MDDFTRFWTDIVGRLTGPLTFRLILQPLMAIFYAYKDGVSDARAGRPPYLQAMFSEPGERKELLGEGLKHLARVIVLGALMDTIYQVVVFKRFYPGELIVVVFLLAIVPYVVFRGPLTRLARRHTHT